MGMYDDDGFEDEERDDKTPKGLRDAHRKLQEKFAAQTEQLNKLASQVATRNLRDVLTEKGLRPGLARVIAKEDVDLTDSKAVEDWLTDPNNQEDFAFSLEAKAAGKTGGSDGDSVDEQSEGEDSLAAQYARLQNAGLNAAPSGLGAGAVNAINGAEDMGAIQAALDAALRGAK